MGSTFPQLPGLSSLSSLIQPSMAPNNPALGAQMKLLGLNSPSMLAPGQDLSGMFGPSPLSSFGSTYGLPMALGGTLASSLIPGRVGKDIGGSVASLGSLAMLASLL